MYMLVFVHRGLFQAIQTNLAAEDAEVNKATRTLSDIKLDDLGIRQEFMYNIKLAKKELQTINKFASPLGRLLCIKRVVSHLSHPIKNTQIKGKDDYLFVMSVCFMIRKRGEKFWVKFHIVMIPQICKIEIFFLSQQLKLYFLLEIRDFST